SPPFALTIVSPPFALTIRVLARLRRRAHEREDRRRELREVWKHQCAVADRQAVPVGERGGVLIHRARRNPAPPSPGSGVGIYPARERQVGIGAVEIAALNGIADDEVMGAPRMVRAGPPASWDKCPTEVGSGEY